MLPAAGPEPHAEVMEGHALRSLSRVISEASGHRCACGEEPEPATGGFAAGMGNGVGLQDGLSHVHFLFTNKSVFSSFKSSPGRLGAQSVGRPSDS